MPAIIVNHPDWDILAPTAQEAMESARNSFRAHSLIESHRTWRLLGSINGVAAWGYAFENGKFEREGDAMNLFGFESPTQSGFAFPAPLTEKYRPAKIQDFAGLDKVKRILTKFAANPRPMAFLFTGPSGTGKTTMAMALASEIRAEVHHVPSQDCTVGTLERVVSICHYVPMSGKTLHMVIVDEADQMSPAAQLYLLSKLDSTAAPPDTIWIFTCNAEDRLQDRFISRTLRLEFSSYGMSAEATELLQRVWTQEVGTATDYTPNFARMVKDSSNNIREALMRMETEILAA